ncbi:hypothetical protein [Bogoriella caseilytica]|uniref:Uncharacterized protein n=1 Tax=Bogoriella caseilytica TaxID=56055 RepID=A0A3N2BCH6_9MICO|nr:hypothetical protein [Bogoriella caseilytica]ROR72967.1 hypothetical protein EDD31_1332 [Bogoriella caseilytica]
MIGIFLRNRANLALAAAGTVVATYYAHSNSLWMGEVNSALQMAATASVLMNPLMTATLAVASKRMFDGSLRFIEKDPGRARMARLSAYVGFVAPFLGGYLALTLLLLASSTLHGSLQGLEPALFFMGAGSIAMWAAIAVIAGSRLPLVVAVPSLMVASFLLPVYAGSEPDTVVSVFTPLSSVGFPSLFEIQSHVIMAQAVWFISLAALGVQFFLRPPGAPGTSSRLAWGVWGIVACGAVVSGVLLLNSEGARFTERAIGVEDAECQVVGAIEVCLYPENADVMDDVASVIAEITADAPAGAFPPLVTEPGMDDGATVVLPSRPALHPTTVAQNLIQPLSSWGVCDEWLADYGDDYHLRREWLWDRSGYATAVGSAPALAEISDLPEDEQWQWWLEPIAHCGA